MNHYMEKDHFQEALILSIIHIMIIQMLGVTYYILS